MAKKKRTTDAAALLHNRFVKGDPEREASIQAEREKANIAGQIFDLRTQAGLTQKQLAALVGTTQSVISRLEDADYGKHTLSMLDRIATSLHCRLEVRIVPNQNGYTFA